MFDPSGDGPETPTLDFDGSTPYEQYVHASVLTHLQQPWSDDPAEMAFLVTTQVMELWFTLLVHEWQTTAQALREDDLPTALAALRRSADELHSLNASWRPIAHLTPARFNRYRSALGDGSGFLVTVREGTIGKAQPRGGIQCHLVETRGLTCFIEFPGLQQCFLH